MGARPRLRGPARRRRGSAGSTRSASCPTRRASATHDPPPADQPEHEWAVALADRAMAEARERGLARRGRGRRPPRRPDPAGLHGRRGDRGAVRRRGGRRGRGDVPAAERGGAPSARRPSSRTASRPSPAACRSPRAGAWWPGSASPAPTPTLCHAIAAAVLVRVCVVGCGAIGALFAAQLAAERRGVGLRRLRRARRRDQPRRPARRTTQSCASRRAPTRGRSRPASSASSRRRPRSPRPRSRADRARVRRRRRVQRAERDRQRGGRSRATCRG